MFSGWQKGSFRKPEHNSNGFKSIAPYHEKQREAFTLHRGEQDGES